jgi:serine/threonine protein kinase
MFTDAKGLALIDFGHAELLGTVLNHKVGSPSYQAPEILLTRPNYVIDQADIYALGCTLFTVLFLDFPLGKKFSKNDFYFLHGEEEAKERFFEEHYRYFPEGKERQPQAVLDLIYDCLCPYPEDRLTRDAVRQNSWIMNAPQLDQELIDEINAIMMLDPHPDFA